MAGRHRNVDDFLGVLKSIRTPANHQFHSLRQGNSVANVGFRSSLGICHERSLSVLHRQYLWTRHLLDTGDVGSAWINMASVARTAEFLIEGRCGCIGHCTAQLMAEVYVNVDSFQRIWSMLTDLDAQLSFLFGRPPSVSQEIKVPKPKFYTLKRSERRLHRIIDDISSTLLQACHAALYISALEVYLTAFYEYQRQLSELLTEDPTLSDAIQEHQFEVLLFLMAVQCRFMRITEAHSQQKEGSVSCSNEDDSSGLRELAGEIMNRFCRQESYSQSWPRTFGAYCASSILLSLADPGIASTAGIVATNKKLQDTLTSPLLTTAATSFEIDPDVVQISSNPSQDREHQTFFGNIGDYAAHISNFQSTTSSPRPIVGSRMALSGQFHTPNESSSDYFSHPFSSHPTYDSLESATVSSEDFFMFPQANAWTQSEDLTYSQDMQHTVLSQPQQKSPYEQWEDQDLYGSSPDSRLTFSDLIPAPEKLRRRKYKEIERMYTCGYAGCDKAYGRADHLNSHIAIQNHGPKRTPAGENLLSCIFGGIFSCFSAG